MLNIKVVSLSLATTALVSFLVFIAYGLFIDASLHHHIVMELLLPGFQWLTWRGLAFGVIDCVLYGVYGGLVFVPVYNFFVRRLAG